MPRRLTLTVIFALLLSALPLGSPPQRDAWSRLFQIPIAYAEEPAGAEGTETEVLEHPLTIVGLSWDDERPDTAWFRTRSGDAWTEWTELRIEPEDHGPDPGTAEHARSRQASDPVWTGAADAVQYRVNGNVPQLYAAIVDTTDRTKSLWDRVTERLTPAPADAAPPSPAIHSRSEWDPSDTCIAENRPKPEYVQVTVGFVHHTAGTNSYSAPDVPGIINGICSYHVGTKGWNDIGYNILVDAFGGVWEGRRGGLDRGVSGAHTGGFNSYSFGVGLLGTFGSIPPTMAMQDSLTDVLAWKAGVHNLDPTGTTTVVSKGGSKWPLGTFVTLNTFSGHRDASTTSCPGQQCYNLLPSFRNDVDGVWSPIPLDHFATVSGDFTGDGVEDGAAFRDSDGTWTVTNGKTGSSAVWTDFGTDTGWDKRLAGDFNRDGRTDIANRLAATGDWHVSLSTGAAFTTSNWGGAVPGASNFVVGDFDADGDADIASATDSGWSVGRSTGSQFSTAGWSTSPSTGTALVADVTGDGRHDLAVLNGGTLRLMRSTGTAFADEGTTTLPQASGWTLPAAGDLTGDGLGDVALHHPGTKTWHVMASTGSGFELAASAEKSSRDHYSQAVVHDFDGDAKNELIFLDAYNGFWYVGQVLGNALQIDSIEDSPYRTTVSTQGASKGPLLSYFAQEFQWLRTVYVPPLNPGIVDDVKRVAGADRFETAAAISSSTFDPGVPVVFIATGLDFPDALSGGVAAATGGGPVLLTLPDAIPASTRAELKRLAPEEIVILGGEAAVSAGVAADLATYTSGEVRRIFGTDRFTTAAAVSADAFPTGAPIAFVAVNDNFPDALAGMPAAAAAGGPILLVRADSVTAPTLVELQRLKPDQIVVLGGASVISEAVVTELESATGATVTRAAGQDRYATAVAVSQTMFSPGVEKVFLAVGTDFPDALAGGPGVAAEGGPLLLSHPHVLPGAVWNEILRLAPQSLVVLGGPSAVSEDVFAKLVPSDPSGVTTIVESLPRP